MKLCAIMSKKKQMIKGWIQFELNFLFNSISFISRRMNCPEHWNLPLAGFEPDPEVIKLFLCSTQLSMKF